MPPFQFRRRVAGKMLPQGVPRERGSTEAELFPDPIDEAHERFIERHLNRFHGCSICGFV
jgi:hypothetical protein